MQLDQFIKTIEPIFKAHEVSVYSYQWLNPTQNKTLEIALYRPFGIVDLNTCVDVAQDVSDWLDQHEVFDFSYTLDVCSAGAEREIKQWSELPFHKHQYVQVTVHQNVQGAHKLKGQLVSVAEDSLTLQYRNKHKLVTQDILKENIRTIRLAVKG